MKVFKLTLMVMCACSVAMPTLAQTKIDPRTAPRTPTKAEMGAAIQIMMTKRAFTERMSKTFDSLDINGDGIVDSSEMLGANRRPAGQIGWVHNPNAPKEILDTRKIDPVQNSPVKTAPVATKPYRAPNNTSVGIPPINADQLQ